MDCGQRREMRTDGDLRSVPILMVSSITDSAFAALLPKGEMLPADNFLVKPIEASVLLAETKAAAALAIAASFGAAT